MRCHCEKVCGGTTERTSWSASKVRSPVPTPPCAPYSLDYGLIGGPPTAETYEVGDGAAELDRARTGGERKLAGEVVVVYFTKFADRRQAFPIGHFFVSKV
jgi:hypothetical protein